MLAMTLLATALALAFLLHCAVVGAAMLACIMPRGVAKVGAGAPDWNAFFGICLGMLANMAGLFLLGMLGWLHLPAIAAVGLVLLASALWLIRRQRRLGGPAGVPTINALHVGTLIALLLLTVLVSLHPPGHWDDTMYQLPLARHIVEHGVITLNEYLRFPLFPQNFNLLFALGLMLGDALTPAHQQDLWQFGAPEVFAQLFASLPLFVMALGLWAASRRYLGSGVPGLLAGITLYMIGPVKSTLGFAYIDNGLAMFCLAAALAVADMAQRSSAAGEQRHRIIAASVLAGLLAGAACGTKYFGVVFATLMGLIVILVAAWAARSPSAAPAYRQSIAFHAALAYAAAVILAGSWWYVRSYLVSGDPAHPAGASLFGFFLWNEGDLAFQHAEQAGHGVSRNPLMFPHALKEAGVLLWLPAFAGLFLRRLSPAIRVLQLVFVAYMLFWFVVTQVPRYLAPVYGLGGLLSFHALYVLATWLQAKLALRKVARKQSHTNTARRHPAAMAPRLPRSAVPRKAGPAPVWTHVLILLAALGYTADRGMKYAAEYNDAQAVLATSGGYTLYQQANLAADAFGPRLVQVGFENGVYFFKGTVIGDWFGPGRYRDILACPTLPCPLPDTAQLRKALQQHDARMLLLSRDHIINLKETDLQAQGWRLLAADHVGVLLGALP